MPKIDVHVHLGRGPAEMRQLRRSKLAEMVNYPTGEMDRDTVRKSLIVAVEPLFLLYLNSEKPVFKKTPALPSRRKRRVRALAVLGLR
jgi:hypothetical protein